MIFHDFQRESPHSCRQFHLMRIYPRSVSLKGGTAPLHFERFWD